MKVLVTGGGGREHALAWRVSLGASVSEVYVAPGNAGTALEPNIHNVNIGVEDFGRLADFAQEEGVGLTIVGPEAPLVDGFVDYFEERGLRCFGPSRAAARLEGSKAFSKSFLKRHGIPTAASATFTDLAEAKAHVRRQGAPIVIKADGLAAGKGVVVARSRQEAEAALEAMLSGEAFGGAGRKVVAEEFLEGEEASFIALCDGRTALPLASSQDHKAAFDGDQGPNTGGMGAYSPAPVVSTALHDQIMERIVRPTLAGMAAEGAPYRGFLYVGLMVSPSGQAKVIEFNCRLGDPEAQPILARLQSDLAEVCAAALDEGLEGRTLAWDERAALGVVMAAGGYPGAYAKEHPISGLEAAPPPHCKVFHAGTKLSGDQPVTNGGRVLCVVGLGKTVTTARGKAYAAVGGIDWQDVRYRLDIGYRAVAREKRT